jgi:NNP family nitrate/nitrite transporter-like MFS transporter
MSDKYGARVVMYAVFALMTFAAGLLALPSSILTLDVWTFTALVFLIGVGMGVGKAAVFKYIPDYFPKDVASVGGLVGLLGALGGFFLPLMFGYLKVWTGWTQTPFIVLFGLVAVSFLWLHVVVLGIKRKEARTEMPADAVTA